MLVTGSHHLISVRAKLADFQARKDAITRDPDLNHEGKSRRMAVLNAEIAAYRNQAKNELAGAWDGIRWDYKSLLESQALADERAARAWNYERLNYQARAVENAIQAAQANAVAGEQAIQMIAQQYEQASKGGDKHLARAWAENAPKALLDRFGSEKTAAALAKRMNRDAEKLLDTPELAELRQVGSNLTKTAVEAAKLTRQTSQLYDPYPVSAWVTNEFETMLEDIHIDTSVDISTLSENYTLTIGGESEAAGQVAEGAAPAAG